MFRVCHAFLSVHCSLVVTCWERANLLVLLYVMFSCIFVTFPCGVLGQVWYFIVLISDPCLLIYLSELKIWTQRSVESNRIMELLIMSEFRILGSDFLWKIMEL